MYVHKRNKGILISIITALCLCLMASCHFIEGLLQEKTYITAMKFSADNVQHYVGAKGFLSIVITPETARELVEVTYESSDPTIVAIYKIDTSGIEYKALQVGSSIITATCEEKTAKVAISVQAAP